MFNGRPMPQQQNPYELAPEVYVAAGRNQGYDKGFDKGYDKGYSEGYEAGQSAGWNAAVNQANPIIEKQKREFHAERIDANRSSFIVNVFRMTVEDFINNNPNHKAVILKAFKQAYFEVARNWLSKGFLQTLPHQEKDYISMSPKTSKFIEESISS